VRVISIRRLREFWRKHPEAEGALKFWYTETSHASWKNLSDIRKSFNTVDMHGRRTIFDVGGNKYRLIARVNFEQKIVLVVARTDPP
jgi:mRNA interferase HigB